MNNFLSHQTTTSFHSIAFRYHASSITYTLKDISIKHAKDVIFAIHQSRENTSPQQQQQPLRQPFQIDVDCNWLAFKLDGSRNLNEAAMKTSDFLEALVLYGFVVTPVCDGEIRYHSKRASTEGVAKSEKKKIQSTVARLQLLATTQQLQTDSTLDNVSRQNLLDRQKELNK